MARPSENGYIAVDITACFIQEIEKFVASNEERILLVDRDAFHMRELRLSSAFKRNYDGLDELFGVPIILDEKEELFINKTL